MKKFILLLFCAAIFFSCSTENAEEENPNNSKNYFVVDGVEYSIEKCIIQKVVEGPDTYHQFVFGKSNLPNDFELGTNYTYNGHVVDIGLDENYIGNFSDTESYHDINYSSDPNYDYATWTEISGSCSVSQNGNSYNVFFNGLDANGKVFTLNYTGSAIFYTHN